MNPVSRSGSSRSTAPVRTSNLTEAMAASGSVAFPMTTCTTSRGLWDTEKVEVYRGPQSTLAGAIYVKTKDPVFRF